MFRSISIASCSTVVWVGMSVGALAQEQISMGGTKIVGGEPTKIDKHPWQVAIEIIRDDGTYLCGGSIILNKWVLSAAHCFKEEGQAAAQPKIVFVKAGATNVNEGNWAPVDKVVVHDGYNPQTFENDIALIKIDNGLQGENIDIIKLAGAESTLKIGDPLQVTGWGVTKEVGGEMPKQLLKAEVPYVDNATCNKPDSYNGTVLPGMMCAGKEQGGVDSCQGDSGGPLVSPPDLPKNAVLVGVVSHGEGCARKLKYGVYTRVSTYRPWIEKVVKSD